MTTGRYNAKTLPTREVVVDILETFDTRSGEANIYFREILEAEEEMNELLHQLWPDFFPG